MVHRALGMVRRFSYGGWARRSRKLRLPRLSTLDPAVLCGLRLARLLRIGPAMGVRHHRDLKAWQQADAVRRAIIELTSRAEVRQDTVFCDQAHRAAASACRNLAEGFWRFRHREFAQFVNIARASLGEVVDCVDEALEKRYLNAREHAELSATVEAALFTSTGLYAYLTRTPTPAPNT